MLGGAIASVSEWVFTVSLDFCGQRKRVRQSKSYARPPRDATELRDRLIDSGHKLDADLAGLQVGHRKSKATFTS